MVPLWCCSNSSLARSASSSFSSPKHTSRMPALRPRWYAADDARTSSNITCRRAVVSTAPRRSPGWRSHCTVTIGGASSADGGA
eukprot:3179862-Prymnesium_polylepis.1